MCVCMFVTSELVGICLPAIEGVPKQRVHHSRTGPWYSLSRPDSMNLTGGVLKISEPGSRNTAGLKN